MCELPDLAVVPISALHMRRKSFFKTVVQKIFALRIPGNAFHRFLAWEFQLRTFAFYELRRIFYYQPMFESQCASVGEGVRMELTPDSVMPPLFNVKLELGDRVRMSARTTFSGARNAEQKPRIAIGDDSYIGHRVVLRAGTEIVIGKHVLIASNVLLSGDPGHPLDAVERRTQPAPRQTLGRIVIGDDAWLAYNVTVLGNVTIGEGAVVAAGSVVTKDVPAHALVAGNPARVIKMLKDDVIDVPDALHAASMPVASSPARENSVVVTADRERARQELKKRYVDLFTTSKVGGPSEPELEAIVDRAFAELDTLPKKKPSVNPLGSEAVSASNALEQP